MKSDYSKWYQWSSDHYNTFPSNLLSYNYPNYQLGVRITGDGDLSVVNKFTQFKSSRLLG